MKLSFVVFVLAFPGIVCLIFDASLSSAGWKILKKGLFRLLVTVLNVRFRPTVDEITLRLEEVEAKLQSVAGDLGHMIEDLPDELAVLFEEQQRRGAEMETELRDAQNKMRLVCVCVCLYLRVCIES